MYNLHVLVAIVLFISINAQPLYPEEETFDEKEINIGPYAPFDPENRFSLPTIEPEINTIPTNLEENEIPVMVEDETGHMKPRWHHKVRKFFERTGHRIGKFGNKVEHVSAKFLNFIKEFLPVFQKYVEMAKKLEH